MNRRTRFSLPFVALVLLAPGVAFAQADPAADEAKAKEDEIVVTAARTILPPSALPLTIDVIDKNALDQQLSISGSVTDAVATLTPSFSPTRQKLSGSGETLRGRSPLYAINGIPQSTPMRDGSRDGFTIDGFFVDRVELIYGSNALQGIGGTGGIVNQVTVGAPKQDGISGRVLLQGTSTDDFTGDGFGYKAAGLVQYRAGRFDATVGAAYEKRGAFYDADGRRVGLNLTQGETQDSNTFSVFGRFGFEVTDTMRLDLIASRFELKGDGNYVSLAGNRVTGIPTSAVRGTPPGKPAASRTESVALSLTDTDLAGGNFISQVFFNRTHDTFGGEIAPIPTFQDVLIAPVGTLFDQSENRSRKFGGKFSYERGLPGFEDLTLTLGFDALFDSTEQRLIATDRVWVPPSDFRSYAPFAQANLALFDKRLRLAGGVRYENVKITIDDYTTLATSGRTFVAGGSPTFDDVLFNGGVIIEPVPGIRVYGSYAEGFTVPDIGRITRAVSTPGRDIDTFLDISPVVSNNREIGLEVKRGPLDASVTYFWSSSDKGQLLISNPGGIFDVQRQRVEIEGLEVNLGVRLPVEGLRANIGYAHLKGRYDSDSAAPDGIVDTDLDGVNISPDRVNLALSYATGPFSARMQTQFYLSRTFHGKANPNQGNNFGGYNLTDAYLRYQTPLGGISLGVQNLLDKQYIDYSSDTRLATENPVLAYFAGRGRTLTLGWDYRF
ncbi:TonB-dependent receptor [Sphingomonas sp. G-3-2-10]|uniref:TonB-dependent receptor n=1 Tax=Sphingomonas sp. G-3-2-10 TaxID=2728838 RepID=UPI001469B190|nr:TonB-dependent receptor [Sphingomonas sp. G-3-2-10]NML05619.1 TonB-dependent receptor [Sphingomonas sp. G-3-2-10]